MVMHLADLVSECPSLVAVGFGGDDDELGERAGRCHRIAVDRGAAVAEQHRHLAAGAAAFELGTRHAQRSGEVGGAEAAQREHVVHHQLAGLGSQLTFRHHHVLPERQHAVVAGRAIGHGRCRERSGGEWLTTHRAAAVDQQAQRGRRLHPAAHAGARRRWPRHDPP